MFVRIEEGENKKRKRNRLNSVGDIERRVRFGRPSGNRRKQNESIRHKRAAAAKTKNVATGRGREKSNRTREKQRRINIYVYVCVCIWCRSTRLATFQCAQKDPRKGNSGGARGLALSFSLICTYIYTYVYIYMHYYYFSDICMTAPIHSGDGGGG